MVLVGLTDQPRGFVYNYDAFVCIEDLAQIECLEDCLESAHDAGRIFLTHFSGSRYARIDPESQVASCKFL
jgi:hypothetical protein